MRRKTLKITITDPVKIKGQLLAWAQQFDEVVWLDSNAYAAQQYSSYEAILAVDALTSLKTSYHQAFDELQEYQQHARDWIFGYLSYDLKNAIEKLKSLNDDELGFPDLYFFQPKRLFLLQGNTIEMHYLGMIDDEMEPDWNDIINNNPVSYRGQILNSKSTIDNSQSTISNQKLSIKLKIHKEAYKNKVRKLLAHIHRGDIYEANFCQEFYAHGTLDPLATYTRLNAISSPPFASFFKREDHFLLCASPERYIRKEGNILISQPIKGTAARGSNPVEDSAFAKALSTDPKERSENIMIVDLVRNDLSRIAAKGSVRVTELCEIYPFKQVHQMISTIQATIIAGVSLVDILKATFPMGSMTGAPKVRAMELIEDLEETQRGLYSGSVGYITPNGNFDFNVVIRSILYNSAADYISYTVGGAITSKSDPDKEYEECLLKAKALRQVLEEN